MELYIKHLCVVFIVANFMLKKKSETNEQTQEGKERREGGLKR